MTDKDKDIFIYDLTVLVEMLGRMPKAPNLQWHRRGDTNHELFLRAKPFKTLTVEPDPPLEFIGHVPLPEGYDVKTREMVDG